MGIHPSLIAIMSYLTPPDSPISIRNYPLTPPQSPKHSISTPLSIPIVIPVHSTELNTKLTEFLSPIPIRNRLLLTSSNFNNNKSTDENSSDSSESSSYSDSDSDIPNLISSSCSDSDSDTHDLISIDIPDSLKDTIFQNILEEIDFENEDGDIDISTNEFYHLIRKWREKQLLKNKNEHV